MVRQIEFDVGDCGGREYKVEAIWANAAYTKELESGYLPGLYHLVFWKKYVEEENTWTPASTV